MTTVTVPVRTVEGRQVPEAGTYVIDATHSGIEFVARHLMVAKVRGRFSAFSGTLQIAEVPEESSVEVTINAASIDTRDEQRDGHLRSPDFLDVETYPTLRFVSTEVEAAGEGWKVTGDLTIRDVTRPVVLDVEFLGATVDPFGGQRVGFSATTEINREDWGITWNQALEAGGWLVGKTVRIELGVEAVRQ